MEENMKRLKFSKETCIGCQLCAQVCSAKHEGEYSIAKARIGIYSYYDKGKELKYKDAFCTLCGICAKKCPKGAITMDDKLFVDHEKCIGCGTCKRECPKEVIRIENGKSVICDLCGGSPICVDICPHGALKYE